MGDIKEIRDFKAGAQWKGYEIGPVVNRGRMKLAALRELVVPGCYTTLRNNSPFGRDFAYQEPFLITHLCTLTGIFCNVFAVGDAGSLMKVAIYRADADWTPGALVLAPVGTMSMAGTGSKALTNLGTDLVPGRYLKMWKHNSVATVTLRWQRASIPGQAVVPGLGAAPYFQDFRVAHTYATAWPDPGPVGTTSSASADGRTHVLGLDLSAVT